MIYTLTTNPAIDMNMKTNDIKANSVNRTEYVKYFPNGKGINVSIVLKHFKIDSRIIGFFGGFSGKYIVDELIKEGHKITPFWVDGITRINVFINSGKDEYKYVNNGAFVPKKQQQEFLEYLKNLEDCDYLVISGSLPPGIDESYYHSILEVCNSKSIKFILDVSTTELKKLLKYKPLLIKPNDDEVKKIFGLEIKDENDAKKALFHMHDLGAQNILLTLGEKGMYFYNGEKIYFCSSVKIDLVSSACAGDSALSAFLSEWLYGGEIESALKKASATGANVAGSDGLGLFDKINEYTKMIKIKEVR